MILASSIILNKYIRPAYSFSRKDQLLTQILKYGLIFSSGSEKFTSALIIRVVLRWLDKSWWEWYISGKRKILRFKDIEI